MVQSMLVKLSKESAMGSGSSLFPMVRSTPALGNTIQKVEMDNTLTLTIQPMMASGSTIRSMASALPNGPTVMSMKAFT